MSLKVTDLTFSFANKKIIQDLNWQIERGEIHGVIGENGVGKTTLLRLIAGSLKGSKGFVTKGQWQISSLLGQPQLAKKLTAREYLYAWAHVYQRSEIEIISIADFFDLELDIYMEKLSQGNQQKVHLIRTLGCDADLYLLDEPMNFLDPVQQEKLGQWIFQAKERKKSFIISTHILDQLNFLDPKLHVLKKGHLHPLDGLQSVMSWRMKIRGSEWEHLPTGSFTILNQWILFSGDLIALNQWMAQVLARGFIIEHLSQGFNHQEVFL